MPETIELAAVRINSTGQVFKIDRPGRHSDLLHRLTVYSWFKHADTAQGFWTSQGRFVTRHEACRIARAVGQVEPVKRTDPQDELFSEDLW